MENPGFKVHTDTGLFQIDGTTLLILCEEGEEEFDPLEMAKHGVKIIKNRRTGRVDRSILK